MSYSQNRGTSLISSCKQESSLCVQPVASSHLGTEGTLAKSPQGPDSSCPPCGTSQAWQEAAELRYCKTVCERGQNHGVSTHQANLQDIDLEAWACSSAVPVFKNQRNVTTPAHLFLKKMFSRDLIFSKPLCDPYKWLGGPKTSICNTGLLFLLSHLFSKAR